MNFVTSSKIPINMGPQIGLRPRPVPVPAQANAHFVWAGPNLKARGNMYIASGYKIVAVIAISVAIHELKFSCCTLSHDETNRTEMITRNLYKDSKHITLLKIPRAAARLHPREATDDKYWGDMQCLSRQLLIFRNLRSFVI